MKYEFSSRIRYSEAGADGLLTLDNLVNYFQDCSAFQSEAVGFGPESWLRGGCGWVIVAWRIRIHEYPAMLQTVTAATWPYSFHSFEGDRNFTLTAEDGRVLAEADSRWVYFDMKNARPIRVPAEEIEAFGSGEPLVFEGYPRHIRIPEDAEAKEPFPVRMSQLDMNRHVNNKEYIRMAMVYLPEGFVCRELLVDYHAQAVYGDMICPYVARKDDSIYVSLENKDGKAYAVVEFRP